MLTAKTFLPSSLNKIAQKKAEDEKSTLQKTRTHAHAKPRNGGSANTITDGGVFDHENKMIDVGNHFTSFQNDKNLSVKKGGAAATANTTTQDLRPTLTAVTVGTIDDLRTVPNTLAYYDLEGDFGFGGNANSNTRGPTIVVNDKDREEDIVRKMRRIREQMDEMVDAEDDGEDGGSLSVRNLPSSSSLDDAVRLRKSYAYAKRCCGVDDHWILEVYQQHVFDWQRNHNRMIELSQGDGKKGGTENASRSVVSNTNITNANITTTSTSSRPVMPSRLKHWLHSEPPPTDKHVEQLVHSFIHDHFHLAKAFVTLFEGVGNGDDENGAVVVDGEGGSADLSPRGEEEGSNGTIDNSFEFSSCRNFCKHNKLSLADVASWLDGDDSYCRDKSVVRTIFEGVMRALKRRQQHHQSLIGQSKSKATMAATTSTAVGGGAAVKRRAAAMMNLTPLSSSAQQNAPLSSMDLFRRRLLWQRADRGILEHVINERRRIRNLSNLAAVMPLVPYASVGSGGGVKDEKDAQNNNNTASNVLLSFEHPMTPPIISELVAKENRRGGGASSPFFTLSSQNTNAATSVHSKGTYNVTSEKEEEASSFITTRASSQLVYYRANKSSVMRERFLKNGVGKRFGSSAEEDGGEGVGEKGVGAEGCSSSSGDALVASAIRSDRARGDMQTIGGGGEGGGGGAFGRDSSSRAFLSTTSNGRVYAAGTASFGGGSPSRRTNAAYSSNTNKARSFINSFGTSASYKEALNASDPDAAYHAEQMREAPRSWTPDYEAQWLAEAMVKENNKVHNRSDVPPILQKTHPLIAATTTTALATAEESSRHQQEDKQQLQPDRQLPHRDSSSFFNSQHHQLPPRPSSRNHHLPPLPPPSHTTASSHSAEGGRGGEAPTTLKGAAMLAGAMGMHLSVSHRRQEQEEEAKTDSEERRKEGGGDGERGAFFSSEEQRRAYIRLRQGIETPTSTTTGIGAGGKGGWREKADQSAQLLLERRRRQELMREFGVRSEDELRQML